MMNIHGQIHMVNFNKVFICGEVGKAIKRELGHEAESG